MAALDARLRKAMSGLDSSEGFRERLQARIAAVAPRTDRSAELERQRQLLYRRLRREAWANGISIAGLGLTAAAAVWRFAPEIERFVADSPGTTDPLWIGAVTLAAVAAGVGPLLRRMPVIRIR
ncbi:MAG: hypothetical protein ACT4UQ_02820 [Gammaproteobacteria bacterium]